MSLINYSDLTAAIESWTGRSDYTAANYSDFTTLFEAWVNRNIRSVSMETQATLTPSAGSATLPSDFMQWRRVTWQGSTISELEYVHPSILQAYYPSSPSATPVMFTIEGTTLKIRPIDGTNIVLDYYQKIPSLVTNSTNWLMTNWPDAYLSGVLAEAYLYNKDPDNMAIWLQRREAAKEDINRVTINMKAPSTVRVIGYTP